MHPPKIHMLKPNSQGGCIGVAKVKGGSKGGQGSWGTDTITFITHEY